MQTEEENYGRNRLKKTKKRMSIKVKEKRKNEFIRVDFKENKLKNIFLKLKKSVFFDGGESIMDNETYSFKLEDGMYIANFDYFPTKIGNHLLFSGILGGKGIYIGHKCIVRSNETGTKDSWKTYMEVRNKLKSIQNLLKSNGCSRGFYVPKSALAIMERVALPTKLLSALTSCRRPKEDEWVLVDLYRHRHKEYIFTGPLFSAISHISLKQSGGQNYLTNFKAFLFNNNSICVTSADVSTDVNLFQKKHECNELCMVNMAQDQSDFGNFVNDNIDRLVSYPVSAPVYGDFRFWNRLVMSDSAIDTREFLNAPPPYSEYPIPSAPAPPCTFLMPPNTFFNYPGYIPHRQLSAP